MAFLIRQTLIYAIPLMIVALAGVFAERSGIINLALEGEPVSQERAVSALCFPYAARRGGRSGGGL